MKCKSPNQRPRGWRVFDMFLEGGAKALIFCLFWAAVGAFLVLVSGFRPRTTSEWLIAILAAPLIWVAGEGAAEFVRALPFLKGKRELVQRQTKGQRFSADRVVYAFVEGIFILVLFAALLWGAGFIGRLVGFWE